MLLEEDCSLPKAEQQMGVRYGHVPWKLGTQRFWQFLDLYEHWLTEQEREHDRELFRRWACEVYTRPEWLGAADIPYYPPWRAPPSDRLTRFLVEREP
jgi:hypothetical protein